MKTYTNIILILILVCMASLESKGQINRHTVLPNATIRETQALPDLNIMRRNIEMAEERDRRNRILEMEAIANCIKQNKNYYNSVSKYPSSFLNGWYNVTVTNNQDFCDERLVHVTDNKVSKYFVDGYAETPISFSSKIENGKAIMKLDLGNGTKSEFLDVFFIENIIDPSSKAKAPEFGQFTFWTDMKRSDKIHISIDDLYAGEVSAYFNSSPSCSQEGTVNGTYKVGTYRYVAEAGNKRWDGTITITNNGCSMVKLIR